MTTQNLATYQASLNDQTIAKQAVPDCVLTEPTSATVQILIDKTGPVTLIGTPSIRAGLDGGCYKQIANTAQAPGVDKLVISPDFHLGYGCPIGTAFSSRSHIYPCAVGPDISCSMAFMIADLPSTAMANHNVRRQVINAISERVPSGPGAPEAKKGRRFDLSLLQEAVIHGATTEILVRLGLDPDWGNRLEDRSRGNPERLAARLAYLKTAAGDRWVQKLKQLGSLGGGNHFLSQEQVSIVPGMTATATKLGLLDGAVGFLTHCGSRGFGYTLTEAKSKHGFSGQFEKLGQLFKDRGWEFPGGDPHMVFAEVGTPEGDDYLEDMSLGANFAILNHLLLMDMVREAVRSVFPSVSCRFVYHIAHNIIREEVDLTTGDKVLIHRKGTTRAFYGGHPALKGTGYEGVGHPVLLPGNCETGSAIMVGAPGADISLYSVNHGAGRCWSRSQAKRELAGVDIGKRMAEMDILSNCRNYPSDEAADAYKNFNEVLRSVELAGLANMVARLLPGGGFVFKDNDASAEGKA